jgi:hypothetical protein
MEVTGETPGRVSVPGGSPPAHAQRVRRSRRKRRKRKRLLNRLTLASGVVLALLTVYGFVIFLRLGQASVHLRAAKAASENAAAALRDNDLDRARGELKQASDEFTRARNLLSAIEVKVLRKVPVVGSNLKVATALSLAGAKVADAGAVVLDKARIFEDDSGRLRFPFDSGKVDIEKVEAMQKPVQQAARSVGEAAAAVEQSPDSMLLGSVSSAKREFLDRIEEVRIRLEEADTYLGLAPYLLGRQGRRSYLVAIGNNAEMNSGGMVLAYGFLDVDRGSFSWGHLGPVTELQLSAPVAVPQEPGFYARWDWANPNFAWQRTNVSIDPQASGSLMGAMIQAKTGRRVDGVIYIDGVAIGYLLRATGPIKFDSPNVTLDATNFADYTMNRAYFQFDNQSARKEFLVEAAGRAIEASFQIRGSAAQQLAEGVSKSISERRLWVWAADEAVEKQLLMLPLGGSAEPDILKKMPSTKIPGKGGSRSGDFASYSLINLAGNKVDYYIHNSVAHKVEIDSSGAARASVKFEIENTAPLDLPEYVGGATGAGQAQRGRGEYLGYLTWYAPPGAELLGAESTQVQSDLPDGGFAAFSWSVRVAPSSKETVSFSYRIPDEYLVTEEDGTTSYALTWVPQPRIRPDKFSSEVVIEGKIHIEPLAGYSKVGESALYYSDSPPSRTRLQATVRFPGRR